MDPCTRPLDATEEGRWSYFVSPKYPDGCWLSWATSAPCLPLFSVIHAREERVIWFLVQFYFLMEQNLAAWGRWSTVTVEDALRSRGVSIR